MYSLLIFNVYSFRKVKGLYKSKTGKDIRNKIFQARYKEKRYICMNILVYTVYREEIEHLNIDATEV